TKVVDTGGYNYKVFQSVIIQILFSRNYQKQQQQHNGVEKSLITLKDDILRLKWVAVISLLRAV
ncbi:hypothetical protein MKW92_015171, partial [Papaver armeniacum]